MISSESEHCEIWNAITVLEHKINYFVWNAIAFLCCKMIVYYVKRWGTLSEKRVNLSIRCAILLKACIVLSTQCLIMLHGHVVMINARVVMSTQCLIMLKGYGVMLNSRVVLSTRSLIMLKGYKLC